MSTIRKYLLAFSIIFALNVGTVKIHAHEQKESLRVMTFNIRLQTKADEPSGDGWQDRRRDAVIEVLQKYQPSIVGLQEVTLSQLKDLKKALPDYDFFGVGRDDGISKGEHAAVFYRKADWRLKKGETRWLSETPKVPSKSWDSSLNRAISILQLQSVKGERGLWFLNTHFDHRGKQAQLESSHLVSQWSEELRQKQALPLIVMGDLNFRPSAPGYAVLKQNLESAREKIEFTGPQATFAGFNVGGMEGSNIDHIFISKDLRPLSGQVITDAKDGKYPSDHLPVLLELAW